MPVMQPNLPYALDALEPHLSAASLSLGYERYHRMAVDTLNARIVDSDYSDLSLDQVIDRARRHNERAILKDACETWNYGFFWQNLKPSGGRREPTRSLAKMLAREFGSTAEFRSRFASAAQAKGGEGWLWLASGADGLRICFTHDGASLTHTESTPLAVLNLSKHAFFQDYGNDAAAYAKAFLEHLIDWDVVASMLDDRRYLRAA